MYIYLYIYNYASQQIKIFFNIINQIRNLDRFVQYKNINKNFSTYNFSVIKIFIRYFNRICLIFLQSLLHRETNFLYNIYNNTHKEFIFSWFSTENLHNQNINYMLSRKFLWSTLWFHNHKTNSVHKQNLYNAFRGSKISYI